MSKSRSPSEPTSRRSRRSGDSSITDVAREADVSIGTVSRVFNHHPNVTGELRRRVLAASRALRFVPKLPHRCIGVVTGRHSPALPVGYVSVMTSLISRHLAARRYAIELIDIDNLELAYEAHVEGVIGVVFDDRLLELRNIPNLPLVTINHPMLEHGIHSIHADHYQQAVLATRHLIARGHRRIALLQIQPDEWGSTERRRGYLDTLREAGIEEDPSLIQFTLQQPLYDGVTRLVRRGASALLNFSEDASLEVLHFLSNILKLRIGQDISTISLEDLPVYQYFTPPQTTVSQPLEDLARIAVEKIMELCDAGEADGKAGASQPLNICLPTTLVERESVARLTPESSSATPATAQP